MRLGRGLDDFGQRRDLRRLERAAERRGRVRRGAERVAMAQERMARRLVGSWEPGDGGRRSRRNLPGGPPERSSFVSRAPTRSRTVTPEAERTPRARGTTPLSQPLRERTSRTRRALSAERLDDERPSRRRGSLADVDVPDTEPTPDVERSQSGERDASPERVQDLVNLSEFMDGMMASLADERDPDQTPLSYSSLNRQQQARVDAAMTTMYFEAMNDFIVDMELPMVPTMDELYDMVDLSTDFRRKKFAQLYAAANHKKMSNPYINPLWNSGQQQRIRNALDEASLPSRRLSRRSERTPKTDTGRDFWNIRRQGRDAQDEPSTPKPLEERLFPDDSAYARMVKGLNKAQLEELDEYLKSLIEESDNRRLAEGREETEFDKYMAARWQRGREIVDGELKKYAIQDEERLAKFEGKGKVVEPYDNAQKNLIPALAPDNQRQQHNRLLASESYLPGEIARPERIVNDDIQNLDDAVAALDSGVPLDEIPQKYWYSALREHMDPRRNNKKQYVQRAKNGGICKNGDNGDLLIFEKLDADGKATGTGVVVGWEGWQGGLGRNGMRNNVGEVIAWNLMNALGLPAEPARFDGIFHQDDEYEIPGIGFAIPFAWNRAPVGKVKQREYDTDSYGEGANFEPSVVEGLDDEGFPHRLANVLFSGLIGVTDRHDGNVMGGLVDGQAFVLPMDLGWGGQQVWDFRRYIDTEFDYEDYLVDKIGEHLNGLDPDEKARQAARYGQVYDTILMRAHKIAHGDIDEFAERVVQSLHIEDYDELPPSVRERIVETARDVARDWHSALRSNVFQMDDIRDEVFETWGLDPSVDYEAIPGVQPPSAPSSRAVPDLAPANPEPSPPTPDDSQRFRQRFMLDLEDRIDLPRADGARVPIDARVQITPQAARKDAIKAFMETRRNQYIVRLDSGEWIHVSDQELADVFDSYYSFREDEWSPDKDEPPTPSAFIEIFDSVQELRYGDLDETDPDSIAMFTEKRFPGADYAFFEETVASMAQSPLTAAHQRAIDFVVNKAPMTRETAWRAVDDLEAEAVEAVARSAAKRYQGDAEVRAMAEAFTLAKARKDLIDALRMQMLDRPPMGEGPDARRFANRTARVLEQLRPNNPRSDARFLFADVRDLEPGQMVVPQAIINPDIQNLQQALDAIGNGVPLEQIPEEFWPKALELNAKGENPRWARFPIAQGAIKTVTFYSPLDSEGLPLGDGGVVLVQDNEGRLDFMGELLGWNLLGAMGLNVGPARLVGPERPFRWDDESFDSEANFGRFVALPHAYNFGARGSTVSPDVDDRTEVMTDWGLDGTDVNFNAVHINREAEDGGIPQRIVALLSQYSIGLPDRHYNNVLGRVVRTPSGRRVADVVPIDLGWAAHEDFDSVTSYMLTDDFYDPDLLDDVKDRLDAITDQEERRRYAREIVAVVDALLERQRAILLRGRRKFVEEAASMVAPLAGRDRTNEQMNIAERKQDMRRKAEVIFTAIEKYYRQMKERDYESFLDLMGIIDVLGPVDFPETKSFHIKFYSTKRLDVKHDTKRRTARFIGVNSG